MTGQVDFTFDIEAEALREYFKRGNFLYADDCDADGQLLSGPRAKYRRCCPATNGTLPRPQTLPATISDGLRGRRASRPGSQSAPTPLFCDDRMVCFLTGSDQHWLRSGAELYNDAPAVVYALTR
jgi:hypothetical protein